MKTKPNAKIAVLYQNDDYGKDYLKGFHDGLGAKKSMIVKEVSYEVADPTVDSQIVQLQASGADVFFNITTPKFAAQAIRKAYDIGWKPAHYLNNVSNSVGSVLTPAGLEKSVGIISSAYLKDATDSTWASDKAIAQWREFMKKYASMKGWRPETLLPGITITTSADDFAPIQAVQLERFNGKQWELFGGVLGK
jgi:branched-chain amino acid transport system substrate-binding protein